VILHPLQANHQTEPDAHVTVLDFAKLAKTKNKRIAHAKMDLPNKDQVPLALVIPHQPQANHQTELDAHVTVLDFAKLAKTKKRRTAHAMDLPNKDQEPLALVILHQPQVNHQTELDAHVTVLDFAKPAKTKKRKSNLLSNTQTIWDTLPMFTHTSQDNSHQTSTSSKEENASSGTWMALLEDSETINIDLDSANAPQLSTNNTGTSTKCQEPLELTQETTLSSLTLKATTGTEKNTELS